MPQIFLTTTGAGTWVVPSNWNNSNNSIECLAGGGSGTTTGGAGGGSAYAKATNVTLTPGAQISYSIGVAATDTWFNGSAVIGSTCGAKHGVSGSTTTGGAGGLASGCYGGVGGANSNPGAPYAYSGGSGGSTSTDAGGGGGAGGPNGAGATGSNGGVGGGGNGGAADNGVGGAGGAGGTTGTAGSGGSGNEWTPNLNNGAAAGSGGGGGGCTTGTAGGGGLYGGGGGGCLATGTAGTGAQGIIVITYTPVNPSAAVVYYLTAGTKFAVPSDWNASLNIIETIGGGGSGGVNTAGGGGIHTTGGGGGAYNFISNLSLNPGAQVAFVVGSGGAAATVTGAGNNGGNTYFNGGSLAGSSVGSAFGSGGAEGSASRTGGAGGLSSNGVGSGNNGGSGGNMTGTSGSGASGGGGAGGSTGAGVAGTSSASTSSNVTTGGGAGDASAGGAGGAAGNNNGSPGTEWTSTGNAGAAAGSGGGGGGNSITGSATTAGSGGNYGAGGGGANGGASSISGAGIQGIIVVTYTPPTQLSLATIAIAAIIAAWQTIAPYPFVGGQQPYAGALLNPALSGVQANNPPFQQPERTAQQQAIEIRAAQPDPWVYSFEGNAQPYQGRTLNPFIIRNEVDNPPFDRRAPETLVSVTQQWQPSVWPYYFIGGQQPYDSRRISIGIPGLDVDNPPFRHPEQLPANQATKPGWQPSAWPYQFMGGPQPYEGGQLPPSQTAVPANNPPFQHPEKWVVNLSTKQAWQPDPWIYSPPGGRQPYEPSKLNPQLTAVEVDNPPFQHPEKWPVNLSTKSSWQPDPWIYAPIGGRQPYESRKVTPTLEAVEVDNPPFRMPELWPVNLSIKYAWQPDPWIYAPIGGRQPYEPRKLPPQSTAILVSNPPFDRRRAENLIANITYQWQPDPWPPVFMGGRQAYEPRVLPADLTAHPANFPPYRHPEQLPANLATKTAWQPDPWPPVFMGGRQPYEPRVLPADLTAHPANFPPYRHPESLPQNLATKTAWQPDPWPKVYMGAAQPYESKKNAPGIPGQSTDNPPIVNPLRAAVLNLLVQTWQPNPWVYAFFGGLQPFEPKKLSPGIPGQNINNPPFQHPAKLPVNLSTNIQWQPDPWPPIFMGGLGPYTFRHLPPPVINILPTSYQLLRNVVVRARYLVVPAEGGYAQRDFDPADPGESTNYGFDLTNCLTGSDSTIVTLTCSLTVETGNDPAPNSHLIGGPVIVGTIVKQRIANLVAGTTYTLEFTAVLSYGDSIVAFSHLACRDVY